MAKKIDLSAVKAPGYLAVLAPNSSVNATEFRRMLGVSSTTFDRLYASGAIPPADWGVARGRWGGWGATTFVEPRNAQGFTREWFARTVRRWFKEHTRGRRTPEKQHEG